MWPFSDVSVSKKSRDKSYTATIDTRRAARRTKRTNYILGPTSYRFFNELSRLGSLLSTKQADVGQIASLKNDGLSFTQRVFGTLGRVALQEPMVATHS